MIENAKSIVDNASAEEIMMVELFSKCIDEEMTEDDENEKAVEVLRACWAQGGVRVDKGSVMAKLFVIFRAGVLQGAQMTAAIYKKTWELPTE